MRHHSVTATVEALERIYREHHRIVRATVIARGVPPAAVDDVVHDVFLTIHRRLETRDPSLPLRHWVVAVARNVSFSHRRAVARRTRRLAAVPRPDPVEPPPVDDIDARAAWAVVSAFLAELPAEQREAFVLCGVQGLSAAEVAQMLGCSANTISSRLRLARRRFAVRFPDVQGLGDHRALLVAARSGSTPSPAHRRAAWSVLVADLGARAGVAAAPKGWAGLAPWFGATAAAVLLTVAGAASMHTPMQPASDVPAQVIVAAPEARTDEPSLEPSLPIPPLPPVAVEPAPRAVVARARPVVAPEPSDDDLRRETRLLRTAREQLGAGRLGDAEETLQRHRVEFARGALRTERVRLEIGVQCALGRHDEASQLAAGLHGITPPLDEVCPR